MELGRPTASVELDLQRRPQVLGGPSSSARVGDERVPSARACPSRGSGRRAARRPVAARSRGRRRCSHVGGADAADRERDSRTPSATGMRKPPRRCSGALSSASSRSAIRSPTPTVPAERATRGCREQRRCQDAGSARKSRRFCEARGSRAVGTAPTPGGELPEQHSTALGPRSPDLMRTTCRVPAR
jgi:hypothetical protein